MTDSPADRPLPEPKSEYHIYAEDAPSRSGNKPERGNQEWTMRIPTDDGRLLLLHVGEKGRAAFRQMLMNEEIDDYFDKINSSDLPEKGLNR